MRCIPPGRPTFRSTVSINCGALMTTQTRISECVFDSKFTIPNEGFGRRNKR